MGRATRETIDIENSGGTVELETAGATIVSVHIRGDASATYQWDVKRPRDSSWIQDADSEYSGSADYDDVFETGVAEVRIRCATGTGGSGDTADILLSAGGG